MKVLIIGRGGREHSLGWKISQSPMVSKIYFAPGNYGMKSLGELINISEENIEELCEFAKKEKIDLTIVGPESSLALGVVDIFEKNGLKIFGPRKIPAQIESSKDFAKNIMKKYKIPTGNYEVFQNLQEAREYLEKNGVPMVIKEDGLKSGKGVTVAFSMEEALDALERAFKNGDNKILMEEYLKGEEFSIIVLVNGDRVIPLEIAQDHKRVFEGEKGPNTGGMGIYSPVDRISEEIQRETMEKIMIPMAQAMVAEGIPFTGFLFGGIMVTEEGVKTIEFNGRFGDPEAQGILPRMKSDLLEIILKLLEGEVSPVEWEKDYTLGVVMASEGYPERSYLGDSIGGLENCEDLVFHMGTKEDSTGEIVTNGGRVLCVLGRGRTLKEAQKKAYENVSKIRAAKLFYRKDIGNRDI